MNRGPRDPVVVREESRMTIDITGRNVNITPAIRDFAADKLKKLERLLAEPIEVHVVLDIEKHRHIAEIQVKSARTVLSSTEETGDLYASIGEAADKLERQALKRKERMRDHKHRRGHRNAEAPPPLVEPVAPSQDGGPRIVPAGNYRVKPMSAEDAVMELEAANEDLLVFREASSNRINVVFRQKDGNFGLIDPDI
jgi:putative sigma-54 modulation protein